MDAVLNMFKREDVLALDIGAGTCAGLFAKETAEGLRIVKVFNRPLSGDRAAALTEVLEGERIPPCIVHMCLSAEHSFLRFAEVPQVHEREIRQLLSVRMDAEMPMPLSRLYWDYWTVQGRQLREAAVVACEQSTIHAYYDVLVEKGFKPQLVTLDVLVLRNLVLKKVPAGDESFVVMSKRGRRLFFLMFEARGLKYFRTLNLADKGGDEADLILQHFSKTIEYCRRYRKMQIPEKIYFLNDDLPEAARVGITGELNLKGDTIDIPVPSFAASGGVKRAQGWPASFFFCLGLLANAVKKEAETINLLPQERQRRGTRDKILDRVFTYRLLGIACGALLLINIFFNSGMRNILTGRMAKALSERKKIEQQILKAEQRLNWLKELQRKRISIADLILNISNLTPNQLQIENIITKETSMTLKGSTKNQMLILDYIKKLSASEGFDEVELIRRHLEKDQYKYEIRCTINPKSLAGELE